MPTVDWVLLGSGESIKGKDSSSLYCSLSADAPCFWQEKRVIIIIIIIIIIIYSLCTPACPAVPPHICPYCFNQGYMHVGSFNEAIQQGVVSSSD